MARSITPIILGLDYQSVWFWIQACRLLQPSSPVATVVIESNEIKTFDDIVVYYKNPIIDERGDKCDADFYQIKFHTNHDGSISYEDLVRPSFIGAKKFSLLEKLRIAYSHSELENRRSRFYLVTPWPIDHRDPLARLVSNQGGEIRLELLSQSDMSIVNQCWKNHLGVDDRGLISILKGLRIHLASNLSRERDILEIQLQSVGLKPSKVDGSIKPYEDLIRKCLEKGIHEFTKETLFEVCSREGLIDDKRHNENHPIRLGVRSFHHWAEYLEDETDYMVCLLKNFDNRRIVNPRLWSEAIYPELQLFFQKHVRRGSTYHLILDAHSSIAFASGYLLSKSGADISPVQYTGSGPQVWRPSSSIAKKNLPDWQFEVVMDSRIGGEVALAISVTHDITQDVRVFLESNLPNVKRLIAFSLGENIGNTSIRDADHAMGLAHSLQKMLRKIRTEDEHRHILHIFASGPNGFLFFLGKFALDFGRIVLYEFNFGSGEPATYSPSLTFPPLAQ